MLSDYLRKIKVAPGEVGGMIMRAHRCSDVDPCSKTSMWTSGIHRGKSHALLARLGRTKSRMGSGTLGSIFAATYLCEGLQPYLKVEDLPVARGVSGGSCPRHFGE